MRNHSEAGYVSPFLKFHFLFHFMERARVGEQGRRGASVEPDTGFDPTALESAAGSRL